MLETFGDDLGDRDPLDWVRDGLIGDGVMIEGADGPRPLVYADYVASGRPLRQVEGFVYEHVLPFYANTHSESSFCGAYSTRMREDARARIAALTGADEDCAVIFAGSGATAGLNRLVALFGLAEKVAAGERPLVLIGPYEHHSNILPWRESGAEIVHIPESAEGGPDLAALEDALVAHRDQGLKIGAFSAASNVTGILTDIGAVTGLLKAHGALSVWDYACAAPYTELSMTAPGGAPIDAIVFSPHKFPGGPAASGVLVVRRAVVDGRRPSWPGGGTVRFVSAWNHDYLEDIESREEAGTPNIIGDIRAALAMTVKDRVGQSRIDAREHELNRRARTAWDRDEHLMLLGAPKAPRLPIFSFLVRHGDGGFVDPLLFTRALSDRYGIQARGGCSCAGIYGHELLGIDRTLSERLRAAILAGDESRKPGWVRLNFSYLMTDEIADFITASVRDLAAELSRTPGVAKPAPDEALGAVA